MTDEQLVKVNQRLAKPPDIDFALARMLGFFVVTQLASRHGIRVQLRHSWYGGITALVLLPRQLLVDVPDAPAAAADAAGRGADPDLDWIGSRVPMVHVPLRRPQPPFQPGPLPPPGAPRLEPS
jgi:hypothetical protein